MKRIFLWMTSAATVLAVSCNKSELQQPGGGNGGRNPLTVRVSFDTGTPSVPGGAWRPVAKSVSPAVSIEYGAGAVPETRAVTALNDENEKAVHDLWALQYTEQGALVGEPFYTDQIQQSDASVTVEINLTSSEGKTNKVYFVANTGDKGLFNASNAATETAFRDLSKTQTAEYKPSSTTGLLMNGLYSGAVGAEMNGVTLKRGVAKVNFSYTTDSEFGKKFTVESVTLKNAANKIHYVKTASAPWPAADASNHTSYPAETLGDDPKTGSYTWYLPENLQTAVKNAKGEGWATYVEIAGRWTGHGDGLPRNVTYYIPVGSDGVTQTNYSVERNKIYTVSVTLKGANDADTRVKVEEAVTPVLANCGMVVPGAQVAFDVADRQSKLTGAEASGLSLKQWQKGSEYVPIVIWQDVSGLVKKVTYEKSNGYVIVETDKAKGSGNAVVGLYPAGTTTENYTNQGCLWSWHVWVTDYQPDGKKNYGLGINSKIDVPGKGQVHTYGTKFAATNPGKVIMDRNLGATKAFYSEEEAKTAGNDADQAFGMFYQWGRKDPFPRVQGSTISASGATGTTIPIYGPTGSTPLPEDGTGYKKVDITAGSVVVGNNSLAYAVAHPLTFIYNGSAPYDWYTTSTTSQNNALWGDGTAKSVYDPCPEGWRIAPNETWSDFGTDAYAEIFRYYIDGTPKTSSSTPSNEYYATNGRLYKPTTGAVRAWYPAPGYRDFGRTGCEGEARYVGYRGYSWSSSVSGSNGFCLDFSTTYLHPSDANYRGHGFQVRCLQE
ncbi:fimbrial protein [Rikenella microfusus]